MTMMRSLISLLLCVALAAAQNDMPNKMIPDTTGKENVELASKTDTTLVPIPTTDATTEDASTVSTENTTPTPIVTTESTSVTTESTTLTEPPTSIPASTTEIPTTVAPKPTIPSIGEAGTWNITRKDGNSTCLKLTMAAQFQVRDQVNNTIGINIASNATVSKGSKCIDGNDEHQVLVLTWQGDQKYEVSFNFINENDTKSYRLDNLTFTIDGSHDYYLLDTSKMLIGHDGKSYKCNSEEQHAMTTGKVIWKDVQVQAFMDESAKDFGSAEECQSDETTSDIVPIAVGCALAGLVIVVLIAYVVGRRISRQKGYQSV